MTGPMNERRPNAFKESLIPSGLDKSFLAEPRLWEFEQNKIFVVRKVESFLFTSTIKPETVAKIVKKLFSELSSDYGINVPVQFVVADDENKIPSLYILTDRINSSSVDETSDATRSRMATGMTSIFSSLVAYFENKYASGEEFLCDIAHFEQYAYGTRADSTVSEWYLVDTDPYFTTHKEVLLDEVEALCKGIPDLEARFEIDIPEVKERAETLRRTVHNQLENT